MCINGVEQVTTVIDGIIIGGAGGAIAGLTVWPVQYIHDKASEKLEKDLDDSFWAVANDDTVIV